MKKIFKQQSKHQWSLSFLVAFWNAFVIAIAMAGYAVFQYYQLPELTLRELFTSHMVHVIVLGGIIYFSCWFVFQLILYHPLKQIYLHLYKLGSGDVIELKTTSSVREISVIIEGINVMIWKLQHWLDSDSLEKTRGELEQIRLIAAQLRMENYDVSEAITRRVNNLEESFLAVVAAKDVENGKLTEDESDE